MDAAGWPAKAVQIHLWVDLQSECSGQTRGWPWPEGTRLRPLRFKPRRGFRRQSPASAAALRFAIRNE